MIFLVNGKGHFFIINGVECDPDLLTQNNCKVFSSLNELYNHVSETTGLMVDEIEGCEYTIYKDEHGCYASNENMHRTEIEGDINEFLINFSL